MCRTFLLYIGPVILRKFLPPDLYQNFLNFSVCVFIACHPLLCRKYGDFLVSYSEVVVREFVRLYGEEQCTFNVHSFSHVFDRVKLYGPLDNYSAFPYESYLGRLKQMVHGVYKPGVQICRRISEFVCRNDETADSFLRTEKKVKE